MIDIQKACYCCYSTRCHYFDSENGFELLQCAACGLLFVSNPPPIAEITQAHKQGLHRGDEVLDAVHGYRPAKVGRYVKILRDFYGEERLGGVSSWLDVGSGHGEFVEALTKFDERVSTVVGSEPNERKRAAARNRGLSLDSLDLERPGPTFDAISALNVFSHLPEPTRFLESLRDRLAPGGEILLETGDVANLSARDHPRPYFLPDHLCFASEEIVRRILQELGFEIVRVRKYPYVKMEPRDVFTQALKFMHPQRKSTLLKVHKHNSVDMYIRARLVEPRGTE